MIGCGEIERMGLKKERLNRDTSEKISKYFITLA